mgnify:CR=1 FL=1
MSVHLFQVTFEAATEIPRDRIVNTWHFEGSGSDPENVADMLTDFYDSAIGGGIGTVSSLMTDQALEGTYWIKGYDLSDAEPRAPIYEDERLLANMDNTAPLPTEVALVMSYHATFASGVPAGRRRGRVYLG